LATASATDSGDAAVEDAGNAVVGVQFVVGDDARDGLRSVRWLAKGRRL
jgi:hypothetical protein